MSLHEGNNMLNEVYKEIIRSFQRRAIPELKPRKITLPVSSGKIISAIGPRRSGKTYALLQTAQTLFANGIRNENIIFINFEDERLGRDAEQLDLNLQACRELNPEIPLNGCHFFFDKIQNVNGWEKFVRRLYDTESKNIYLTGSNARFLSVEIATELRGRSVAYEIYPLSFDEYLQFANVAKDFYDPGNKSMITNAFSRFLSFGGFPETVFFDDALHRKTLTEYFNTMLFKDIVERYQVSDVSALKIFLKKIFLSVGKPFSVNRIFNDLKSMNIGQGKNTLYTFLQYFNNAYLTVITDKYDKSEIKQIKSNKKAWPVDHGFLPVIDFSFSQNFGKSLENLVLLELIKAGYKVFYEKQLHECDFVVQKQNQLRAIQVCYFLNNPHTLKREVAGLAEACKALGLDSGIILTFGENQTIYHHGIKIDVMETWRFLIRDLPGLFAIG